MRKAQKKQIEELIRQLEQAHEQIKEYIDENNSLLAMQLLEDCQNAGISIGTLIESTEGEGHPCVSHLEDYCELTYQIHESLSAGEEAGANKTYKLLRQKLIKVSNSVRNDIPIRKEAVFLPYKASMWDSLESVWQAAEADPDCDAYVIPIPYYDRNPDGSFGRMHYEGDQYPDYVPITKYDAFDFGMHRPDMIFIHNPYDNMNLVTSIDPFFYSDKLKKVTDCLVYIPYFTMSGGMSESKALCPAYVNADYIVIQSEKYRKYFDVRIPNEKFLAFGSPKFDSVIHKCQNPPEPPKEWKEKMAGKKVYFYNTSIGGMLMHTEKFLRKMEYVFRCFQHRDDVCLVWRPHPLLESTFASMRKPYYSVYENLKRRFIEEDLGIYDDSPEIETTIALCDFYIGDASSSVLSLFGMTGKPIFRLNNNICREPQEDDCYGEIMNFSFVNGGSKWKIIQGDKLYYSRNNDYCYEYYCDLSDYALRDLYQCVIERNGKLYICPANAQDIIIVKDKTIIKKIVLKGHLERNGAFYAAWDIGNYIFLIPKKYPAIVRLDTRTDKVSYITAASEIFINDIDDRWGINGSCIWKQYLMIASSSDNRVLVIDSENMEVQVLTTGAKNKCGCLAMINDGNDIWLLPHMGKTVTRWNPETGEVWEYADLPDTFRCIRLNHGFECEERPFSAVVPYKNHMIFSPCWGNMFLELDKETGVFCEWKPPIEISYGEKNEYFSAYIVGIFRKRTDRLGEWTYSFFDVPSRKLYDINLDTRVCQEIPIVFNKNELMEHTEGFCKGSEGLVYCCSENAFNSLSDLLNETITGNAFDKEKQLQAYREIATNCDGTCGESIYRFVTEKI